MYLAVIYTVEVTSYCMHHKIVGLQTPFFDHFWPQLPASISAFKAVHVRNIICVNRCGWPSNCKETLKTPVNRITAVENRTRMHFKN